MRVVLCVVVSLLWSFSASAEKVSCPPASHGPLKVIA